MPVQVVPSRVGPSDRSRVRVTGHDGEMWLTSYDPEGGWSPSEVTLLQRVQIGGRNDYAWVRLNPAIPLANSADLDRVILGARHQGFDIWVTPERWPIHVYICTVSLEVASQVSFRRDQVQIVRWGRIHETLEKALSNEM